LCDRLKNTTSPLPAPLWSRFPYRAKIS